MNTVDTRITEMRFDNRDFEKNIKESMATLDKFRDSLDLSDSAKEFTKIERKTVDVHEAMEAMGDAVSKTGDTFKDLVKKALVISTVQSLVDGATASVTRLYNEFSTLAMAKAGFGEYELKMGSIQTIMASTGADLDTVNSKLDELNEYADRTIYSFSDMTANIGKFTNAGVELEDAVNAIKGVSNVAAVSGANANEASRAMYNFAQALSAGYVKLIDWKSIENANMATVEFKNQLLETALAEGTLTQEADGMYRTLEGRIFNATSMFNESLQDQWMTTKVLTRTLSNYADDTTEIGQKAYAAAQDIKTLTQLVDTLKEGIGSSWAKTWELFIGDFEQAKETFSTVGKYLGDLIGQIGDARNNLLEGWSDLGGRQDILDSIKNIWDAMLSILRPIKQAFNDVFESLSPEKLKSITQWLNDFTSGLILSEKSSNGLRSAFRALFAILSTGIDILKAFIRPFLELAGYYFTINDEIIDSETGEVIQETTTIISKLLEVIGKLSDKITKFLAMNDIAKYFEFAAGFIVNFIATIIDGVGTFVGKISSLISELKGMSSEDIKELGRNAIDNFISGLEEKFETIKEKVKSIGRSIASLIKDGLSKDQEDKDAGANVVSGFVTGVKNKLSNIKESASEFFHAFIDKVKELFDINSPSVVMANIADDTVKGFTNKIENLLGKVKESASNFVSAFVDKVSEIPSKISEIFTNAKTKINESGFGDVFVKIFDAISTASQALWNVLSAVFDFLKEQFKDLTLEDVLKTLSTIGKVKLEFSAANFLNGIGSVGDSISGFIDSWKRKGIDPLTLSEQLKVLADAILEITIAMLLIATVPEDRLTSVGLALAGVLTGIYIEVSSLAALPESKINLTFIIKLLKQLSTVSLIMALTIKILSGVKNLEAGEIALGAILSAVLGFIYILERTATAYATGIVAMEALKNFILLLSVSILIIALAVKKLGKMKSEDMWTGIAGVLAIIAIVALLILAIQFIQNKIKNSLGAGTELATTAALLLTISELIYVMALAVKKLGKMNAKDMWSGIAGVLALAAIISILILVIQAVSSKINSGGVAASAAVILAISVMLLAMVAAIMMLSIIKPEKLIAPVLAIVVVILAIMALVAILGSAKLSMSAVLSILAIALALVLIMTVIGTLGALSFGLIAAGIIAIAVALAIFILAAFALQKLKLETTLTVLATAFLEFGLAIALIGVGLLALVEAFDLLASKSTEDCATIGANLASLVGSFVSTLMDQWIELIPKIATFLIDLAVAIIDKVAESIGTLVHSLVNLLTTLFFSLIDALLLKDQNGESFITKLIDRAFELVLQIWEGLVDAINKYAPRIAEDIWDTIIAILDALIAFFDEASDRVGEFIDKIVELVDSIRTFLQTTFENLGASILAWIISGIFGTDYEETKKDILDFFDEIKQAWQDLKDKVMEFLQPVIDAVGGFWDAIVNTWNKISEFFENFSLVDTGKNIIDGITDKWNDDSTLLGKVHDVGSKIKNGLADFFGIHSPSRLMREEIGKNIIAGLADGIDKYSVYSVKAAEEAAADTTSALENGLSLKGTDLSSVVSTDPVIRPILDLSDVIDGAQRIGGILGGHSLGLAAEVAGSINNSGASGIVINMEIYGAEGQDVRELADIVSNRINTQIMKKGRAW